MRPRRTSTLSRHTKLPPTRRNGRLIKNVKIDIIEESPPPPSFPKKKAPPPSEPVAEVISPRRKRETPTEKVCPPPEYCPLDYKNECPIVIELLGKEVSTHSIAQMQLIRLQHDLEHMLAFATDTHNRATGEVAFLTSGDYPTVDLKKRPSPIFTNRFIPDVDDNVYTLDNLDQGKQVSLCGLPVDQVKDDIDVWPPSHIPTRFWKWCYLTFLTPIDADFLRLWKSIFLDPILVTEFQKLYINEPWKHRKREKRGRPPANSKRKKAFSPEIVSPPPVKRNKPPQRDRIYISIANIIDIVCKEDRMPQRLPSPPPLVLPKRVGRKKREKILIDPETKSSIMERFREAYDMFEDWEKNPSPEPESDSEPQKEPTPQPSVVPIVSGSPASTSPRRSLRSPRMTSPKIKIESMDVEEEESIPVTRRNSSARLNGKIDFSPSPRRRNGERRESIKVDLVLKENDVKKENDDCIMRNGHGYTNGRKMSKEKMCDWFESPPKLNGKAKDDDHLLENGHKSDDPSEEMEINGIEEKHLNGTKEHINGIEEHINGKDDDEVEVISSKKKQKAVKKKKTVKKVPSVGKLRDMKEEIEEMDESTVEFKEEESEGSILEQTVIEVKPYVSFVNGDCDDASSDRTTSMRLENDMVVEYVAMDQKVYAVDEKLYHEIGENIIQFLVAKKQLPEYVLTIYPFFFGHDLNIYVSEEGKLSSEDPDELDEVSAELMVCQKELKEDEPEIRGIIEHCYKRLLRDFSFWETHHQLDEADNTLFRLIVNTYNEFPRRFPKPNEWPSILTALSRRAEKVKLHYGRRHRKQAVLAIDSAKPIEDPNEVEELR